MTLPCVTTGGGGPGGSPHAGVTGRSCGDASDHQDDAVIVDREPGRTIEPPGSAWKDASLANAPPAPWGATSSPQACICAVESFGSPIGDIVVSGTVSSYAGARSMS